MDLHAENKNRIIFIAPFWKRNDHIGRYRVERFVRWMVNENYHVTVIWSGWKDEVVVKDKWTELEIRDPLRKFTRTADNFNINRIDVKQSKRRFNPRILIQKIIFYFDRELLWSIWITKKNIVKSLCKNSQIVITSSPPESTHLASYLLSKKYNLKLIVDMRDGWIDEPLRSFNRKWSLKRLVEKKVEFIIVKTATKIFVTTEEWKKLLTKRLPFVNNKTTVVTNAYPHNLNIDFGVDKRKLSPRLTLLHCGRFIGSRNTNRVSLLLNPLSELAKINTNIKVEIVLLGNLFSQDYKELIFWEDRLKNTSFTLIHKNPVPRENMFVELNNANGLLLLAASIGSIPSKTFEYINSGKPIFAVTLKNSAVWQMGENIPQMFLFDYSVQRPNYTPLDGFIKACQTGEYECKIPKEYSEEYLSKIFLNTIKNI